MTDDIRRRLRDAPGRMIAAGRALPGALRERIRGEGRTTFIVGGLAILLFAAFVGGLAVSIGATPFIIITVVVLTLAIAEFLDSVLHGDNLVDK